MHKWQLCNLENSWNLTHFIPWELKVYKKDQAPNWLSFTDIWPQWHVTTFCISVKLFRFLWLWDSSWSLLLIGPLIGFAFRDLAIKIMVIHKAHIAFNVYSRCKSGHSLGRLMNYNRLQKHPTGYLWPVACNVTLGTDFLLTLTTGILHTSNMLNTQGGDVITHFNCSLTPKPD